MESIDYENVVPLSAKHGSLKHGESLKAESLRAGKSISASNFFRDVDEMY